MRPSTPRRQPGNRHPNFPAQTDRFIPARQSSQSCEKLDILDQLSVWGKPDQENCSPELLQPHLSYHTLLYSQLLGVRDPFTIYQLNGVNYAYSNYPFTQKFRVLEQSTGKRQEESPPENLGYALPPCCGFTEASDMVAPPRVGRKIPRSPFKVLDAPALQDDFYLNVVDWSSQGLLGVGLGSAVYIWSSGTGKVTKLSDVGPDDSVTSLSWSPKGHYLSVGTQLGAVQLWDAGKCQQVRALSGHLSRVGTMAWTSQVLSTGSRDKRILLRDVRQPEDSFFKLQTHRGGGTADRTIRFWNTLTNRSVGCVDTGSQVCSLLFSRSVNELASAHGYSQNNVIIWKYPCMRKLAALSGHTSRVLYMALGNDGETLVTGAGDETLRFWKAFPPVAKNSPGELSPLVPSGKDLR